MSYSAVIEYNSAEDVRKASARYERNRDKNRDKLKNKIQTILKNMENKVSLLEYEMEIKKINNLINSGFQEEALQEINNLEIVVESKIKKLNSENMKKEILKVKVNTIRENIQLNLYEDEELYFKNNFDSIDRLLKKIDSMEYGIELEKLVDDEINKIKKGINEKFNKLDLIDTYISSITGTGFRIENINYNSDNDKFFIYATKDGKYFDSSIGENSEIELHFEGYSGNNCKMELEKVAEYAAKNYKINTRLKSYEGKPNDREKDAVNKSIGGN